MADSSNPLRSILFLGVFGSVLALGWNEPLRYRLMSPTAIVREQQALRAEAVGAQVRTPTQWQARGTALDRAPYRTSNRGASYSGNIDQRKLGIRSETERRENLRGR